MWLLAWAKLFLKFHYWYRDPVTYKGYIYWNVTVYDVFWGVIYGTHVNEHSNNDLFLAMLPYALITLRHFCNQHLLQEVLGHVAHSHQVVDLSGLWCSHWVTLHRAQNRQGLFKALHRLLQAVDIKHERKHKGVTRTRAKRQKASVCWDQGKVKKKHPAEKKVPPSPCNCFRSDVSITDRLRLYWLVNKALIASLQVASSTCTYCAFKNGKRTSAITTYGVTKAH